MLLVLIMVALFVILLSDPRRKSHHFWAPQNPAWRRRASVRYNPISSLGRSLPCGPWSTQNWTQLTPGATKSGVQPVAAARLLYAAPIVGHPGSSGRRDGPVANARSFEEILVVCAGGVGTL